MRIFSVIFLLLLIQVGIASATEMSVGTEVYVSCEGQGNRITDQMAKNIRETYIGYRAKVWWMLFDESGKALSHVGQRPSEFKVWNVETEEWPREKAAVQMRDRMFERSNGDIVSEIENVCFWLIADEGQRDRFGPTLLETYRKASEKIKKEK